MTSYDFIFGSKVTIQCQAQINLEPWKDQEDYLPYLDVIKKDSSFFKYWCKIRNAVTCVVDEPPREELDKSISAVVGTHKNAYLKERHRAVGGSRGEGKLGHVSGSGHGKQLLYIPFETFCARDQGVSFKIPKYTSSQIKL